MRFSFRNLSKNPVLIGILILTVSVIIFCINLIINILNKPKPESRSVEITQNSQNLQEEVSNIPDWELVENKEFKFSLQIPSLLLKREMRSQGGYIDFIRFEENQFSNADGLAIGITSKSIEEEERSIIEQIKSSGFYVEPQKKEVMVAGKKAIKIVFPETESSEAKEFLILNNGTHTISISTSLKQMGKIESSFKFLE